MSCCVLVCTCWLWNEPAQHRIRGVCWTGYLQYVVPESTSWTPPIHLDDAGRSMEARPSTHASMLSNMHVGGRAFFLRIFIFSERKRIHACHSEQSQDRTYKYTPFHLSPHACVIYAYYTQTSLSNTCFPIYRTQHKYSITWFDTLTPSRVT